MTKILLVDGQVFQTEARDRGMGRYSASLIRAILATKQYDEVRILLSQEKVVNPLGAADAEAMFPGAEIVHLGLQTAQQQSLQAAWHSNKLLLSDYVRQLDGDVDYLIPCPFQEPTASIFPAGTRNILVFYDLIPYLYFTQYQDKMPFENYLKRFAILLEADVILAISRSVADDLITYLGIHPDRVAAIDGAPIEAAASDSPKAGDSTLPSKFVLLPTSDDPRKNNMRAVLGFEEFRRRQTEDYKLVVTSKIHKNEREKLEIFSKNLIFTGNVSAAAMDHLYKKADVVLFVPENEGLGLPILEAVRAEKQVVCSAIKVFQEISPDGFYYCNHEDAHEIAAALAAAVADKSIPVKQYKRILEHYNWRETARRALLAINSATRRPYRQKPKLAVFTPIPSGLSAVGKVVAETHPALSELFAIDYYVEEGEVGKSTRPNYLPYLAPCYPAASFSVEQYRRYDAVVYHIGNSEYHIQAIKNALYLPGIVIAHDTDISEAYRVMVEQGNISPDRKQAEERLSAASKTTASHDLVSVVQNQLAVVAHSAYAAKAVNGLLTSQSAACSVLQLPTGCPHASQSRKTNKKLRIGLAGIIADIKGLDVIEDLAGDSTFAHNQFSIFGFNYAAAAVIDNLLTYPNIELSTNLTDFAFQTNLARLDVFVNYRLDYHGETSLSTLEAMREGVVVIVHDVGWYSELPDDVVIKVKERQDIKAALGRLVKHPDEFLALQKQAQSYVAKTHSHAQYAAGIEELLAKSMASKSPARTAHDQLVSGSIRNAQQLQRIYEEGYGEAGVRR